MLKLTRYENNPILSPDPQVFWESQATFNASIIKDENTYHLLYRAMSGKKNIFGKELNISSIGHAKSLDGINFTDRNLILAPGNDWDKFGCEDPRLTKIDDEFYIFYTALSDYPPIPPGIKVGLAISEDLNSIKEKHLITPFNAKAMALFPEKINNKFTAVLTIHTDTPPSYIVLAQFNTKEEMWSPDFWREWYRSYEQHIIPLKRINIDHVEVGAGPIKTKYGWLLVYSYIRNYFLPNRTFGIEAVLLDYQNPQKIIGMLDEPFLTPEEDYEIQGNVPNVVFPSSAIIDEDNLNIYYGAADTRVALAFCKLEEIFSNMQIEVAEIPKLKRYSENPIIQPVTEHSWEKKAVFNPSVIYENNQVHFIYRAMSEDNTSVFGYANSKDGYHIDQRLKDPAYVPRKNFELKKKPFINSGCEDARITRIDNTLYMCYTAYNGEDFTHVALSSIPLNDFLNQNWSAWKEPVIISPPGVNNKNACILPEKINNKYVIFHRIDPNIVIDFVIALEFGENIRWLDCKAFITPRKDLWDSEKIGICGTPIKTNYGWLLLYHGVSKTDHEYRIGAMLLDLHDPAKVIARTKYPILEPEVDYERSGLVNNVVFSCGAVVIGGELFVYYGGGDKVICLATINLEQILSYLIKTSNKPLD